MNRNVVLCLEDSELPELAPDESRLVVAANGSFSERRTPMYTTSARLLGPPPGLAEHYQYCRLACGKINRTMHAAMLAFFLAAHRLHGGEAALVLLYHVERKAFRWHCPDQTVEVYQSNGKWWAADTVRFEHPYTLADGYVIFGDAHLHPGSPHPSAIDTGDDQDGLHIIVGDMDRQPRYHVDFVMDGVRFGVKDALIFEDPACGPAAQAPRAWLDRIRVVAYQPQWTAAPKQPVAPQTWPLA
jgi:hypothetical protein